MSKENNWLDKIKSEFIVLGYEHKDFLEKEYGMDFYEIQSKMQAGELEVDNKYKLILLDGFKDVAKQRGYRSVTYPHTYASPDYVEKVCRIEWFDETNPEFVTTFEDSADAHRGNTFSWYANFLSTAATNRAFVRCVRNFLGIPVLGKDEIGPKTKGAGEEPPQDMQSSARVVQPTEALKLQAEAKGYDFDSIKKAMIDARDKQIAKARKEIEKIEGAKVYSPEEKEAYKKEHLESIAQAEESKPESYKTFGDIPKSKCFALIGWLEKQEKKNE